MTTNNSWYGWEKVRRIGRGGYGEVYEIHRSLGSHKEKAALKLIRIPADVAEVEMLQRNNYSIASITKRYEQQRDQIVQEYQMMQRLRGNPNIVQCNDIQIDSNPDGFGWQIGIRMELLTPLDRYLGKNITQQQVIDVGVQICNALIACKNNNIIHRDIKSDNILVAEDGTIKLGDFGIAKVSEFTAPGTSIGTPGFEAPEVYNHREYGASADIYSLGLVLYWMLNERTKPFLPLPPEAPTAMQEAEARERRYRGEPLPAPKNGSQELKQIVLKAAAYQPRDRYVSAGDLQQALLAVSGNSSFYAGNAGTAGNTAYSQRQATGGWGNTTGGNTQYGYTSGSQTSGNYTSGGYAADGNTVENTQYSYTRGSADNTFGNSWTERTQAQERTSSGWTQPNTTAEKTSGASFYTQPKTEQKAQPKAAPKATPKAAAVSAKPYASATKKKSFGQRLFIWLMVILPLCIVAAGIFLPKDNGIFGGGGEDDNAPIISSSVPGVEVTDIPGDDANTLTFLGTIEGNATIDDDGGLRVYTGEGMEDISHQIHYSESAHVKSMLNFMGQDTYGLSVIDSGNLGEGLFMVQAAVNEVNGIGLINLSGEVLLQPEAALMGWPNYDTGRYLLVSYATEETQNSGPWQVALEDGYRHGNRSDNDRDGVRYLGYTKVFDLVNKQFVPGIRLDNCDWNQIHNCGDYFGIQTKDEKGYLEDLIVYDENGDVVTSYGDVSTFSEFAVDVDGYDSGIYDFSGNQLFADDDRYSYYLNGQYVERTDRETEENVLMDLSGNVVTKSDGVTPVTLKDAYCRIEGDRFILYDEKNNNSLVTFDGEEVLPSAYSSIYYCGSGYFEANREAPDGTYVSTIVGKNGVVAEDINNDGYDLIYEDDNRVLILNERSFMELGEDSLMSRLAPALIAYRAPNSDLMCVYDVFTGNQLLPAEYSEVECINGKYLYAQKDGIWEVYEVQSTFIPE